jgi:hypothetical protein
VAAGDVNADLTKKARQAGDDGKRRIEHLGPSAAMFPAFEATQDDRRRRLAKSVDRLQPAGSRP